jgi:ABC-2 type transport system permease protein
MQGASGMSEEAAAATKAGSPVPAESLPRGLPKLAGETGSLYVRQLRRLSRQPTIIVFSLVQPLIWLVLFGQMFSRIVRFPGAAQQFGNVSYLQFFIPTVMLQSVLFGAGQSGVGMITDIDSGFLDKLLTTPINRLAILLGRVFGDLTRMTFQIVLVVLIGWAIGGFQTPHISFYYGIGGVLGALVIAMMFALVLMGFNVFIALTTRSTEATFLLGNFLTLPLLFTSSAQLPIALLPHWMQIVARVNPVTYTINAMRVLLNGPAAATDHSVGVTILLALGILLGLATVTMTFATRRFQSTVA